jgi:hypothetical protein
MSAPAEEAVAGEEAWAAIDELWHAILKATGAYDVDHDEKSGRDYPARRLACRVCVRASVMVCCQSVLRGLHWLASRHGTWTATTTQTRCRCLHGLRACKRRRGQLRMWPQNLRALRGRPFRKPRVVMKRTPRKSTSLYGIDWDKEFRRDQPATPRYSCEFCGEPESPGRSNGCDIPLCDECADWCLKEAERRSG